MVMAMDMARKAARSRRRDARRRPPPSLLALATLLAAGGAFAQTSVVTPSLNATLTWTDNASTSGIGGFGGLGGSDRGGDDWILEVSPAVSIYRDSGRLSGSLNANFRNVMYASSADRNTSYLALSGSGQFEAIENMLFIDADASISRSNLSTFSTRGPGDDLDVNSDNETRVFSLSPRFMFRIGDNTRGSLQYRYRWSDSGGSQLADQSAGNWSAQISNTQITGIFGLGVDYSRTESDNSGGSGLAGGSGTGSSLRGGNTQQSARATLYAKVTPELRLRGIVGRESNDYSGRGDQSSTVTGGGFDWNPTDRTTISGTVERRIFGRGYDLSFQHRLSRTALFATFSRDIQSSLDLIAGGGLLDPLFQPLFQDPLLAALYPDPVVRRDAVLLILRRLRGDVLTNAYFVTRSLSGGVTYSLPRGVLSLTLSQSENSRLGSAEGLSAVDDFRNF
ncbi:MAG: TIGR03016 family PEP-CTERM system-associated outer membrane protein, partial [Betaproteobacteria bacterium]